MKYDSRIDLRLYQKQKAIIEEAALIKEQEISEYIRTVILEHSRAIIETYNQVTLSNQDRDLFLTIIDADTEPNNALTEAFSR